MLVFIVLMRQRRNFLINATGKRVGMPMWETILSLHLYTIFKTFSDSCKCLSSPASSLVTHYLKNSRRESWCSRKPRKEKRNRKGNRKEIWGQIWAGGGAGGRLVHWDLHPSFQNWTLTLTQPDDDCKYTGPVTKLVLEIFIECDGPRRLLLWD